MRCIPIVLALAVFSLPFLLPAYSEQFIGNAASPVNIAWSGSTISYAINRNTSASLPNVNAGSNPVGAIQAAFTTLEGGSGLTLNYTGTSTATSAGNDGRNLITFIDNNTNRAVVGGALAVAVATFNSSTGVISDADIVFNPAVNFSTDAAAGTYDIEAVGLHEGGHFLGLAHCPLMHTAMYPFVREESATGRSLSDDDVSALQAIYTPGGIPGTGSVTGRVVRSGSGPVFGAHVVLQDAITGEATASGVTRPDGVYEIKNVRRGIYHVYAEPLDEPFTPLSLSGGLWGSATMDTDFRTIFRGGTTTPGETIGVKPGVNLNLGDLTVSGPTPTRNLRSIALSPVSTSFSGFSSLHVTASAGTNPFLVIGGPGMNTVADSAFRIDSPFFTLGPGSLGSGSIPQTGDGYKFFPLRIAAGTPPGGYSVRVTIGAETSILSGAIRILPSATPDATAVTYGAGCGRPIQPARLTPAGQPSIGNSSFVLNLTGSVGGQLGYFLLSLQPDDFPIGASCSVYIDAFDLLLPLPGIPFPMANNLTTIPTPVPNDPGMRGARVYIQCVTTDPNAPLGIGLTNGVLLRFE